MKVPERHAATESRREKKRDTGRIREKSWKQEKKERKETESLLVPFLA